MHEGFKTLKLGDVCDQFGIKCEVFLLIVHLLVQIDRLNRHASIEIVPNSVQNGCLIISLNLVSRVVIGLRSGFLPS